MQSSDTIGEVTFYQYRQLDGALVLPEEVDASAWVRRVDGGSQPEVSLTAPQRGYATCLIIDAKGSVLAQASGSDGESISCVAPRSDISPKG